MLRLLPLLLLTLGIGIAPSSSARPNILLIYSDDHGWADLGRQGVDRDVSTPELDRLAADGVLFKRGYVTAPQCTPSRAGVITGRYQNRFGVEHNGIAMRSEVVTLPERLREAGYRTGMSGKWHLNVEDRRGSKGPKNVVNRELSPPHQGFDEYFEGFMQDYEASHGLDGTPYADAPRRVRDGRCRVVIQTEAALAFLRRRESKPDQPWFHYLAFMAPHVPLESPEPWFSRTPPHLPRERRQALALVAAIDEGLGRVRARIREMGQEGNTLVFFIGDNGAPLGGAWNGSINGPMRGQKGMLSEGGIRVPFIAAWPGRIPAGLNYDHPVISLDVAATALAAAGVARPADLDGVDLLPHLTGKRPGAPHETLYWRWMSQAAIQEFPYKLIALGGRPSLLFDVTTPEGESIDRNLAAREPAIAARLEAKLRSWTATLQPPGMPPPLADRHVQLFAEHGISAATPPEGTDAAPKEGGIRGWICRNGAIAIRDGALVITPDVRAPATARPFITTTDIDLAGPVTAKLRIRARQGGRSTVTWRTKTASFTPEQKVEFDWPASAEWSEIKVELPEKSRLVHLRITPAKSAMDPAVQSIELRDAKGRTQSWRFDRAP